MEGKFAFRTRAAGAASVAITSARSPAAAVALAAIVHGQVFCGMVA